MIPHNSNEFNPQQQGIIVINFDVASYSATGNTFPNVYFSSTEDVFPSSQDLIMNLVCLLVYFLSRIVSPFNSLHPEQDFSLKTRAT